MAFLVVSYKASYEDFCRGCHMGSYPSEQITDVCDTKEEVIKHIVACNTSEKCWGQDQFEHEVYEVLEQQGKYGEEYEVRYDEEEVQLRIDAVNEQMAVKEAEEKQLEKIKASEAQEAREKAEFLKLKEKYG